MPDRLKQALKFVAFLFVIVAIGGGTWAWSSHDSDNGATEETYAATAQKNADARAAEAAANGAAATDRLAAKRKQARKDAKAFCAGERGFDDLDGQAVYQLVQKDCPVVLAAAEGAPADEPATTMGGSDLTPPGNMNIDAYCNSRFAVAFQGNGPESPFFDYTDEDIALSRREFNAFCSDYDIDESLYY